MAIKGFFASVAFAAFFASVAFPQDAPQVRTGIKEIFGESRAAQAKLGLVNNPSANEEERALSDIVRMDLELIGLVEITELEAKDVSNFNYPRLEIKAVKSKKGYAAHVNLAAGQETLASKNFNAPDQTKTRRIGHKIAEMTLKSLTGEKGFFTSRIAFTLRSQKNKNIKELWVADWDGKNAAAVTQWSTVSMLPAFSPDGREIAFTSYREGNPDLYIHDLVTNATRLFSGLQGLNASASFDPLGQGVAVTLSRGQDPNLYLISREGKILNRLTSTMGVDTAATFSPNGQEIAFTTDRSGNPQIFIMSKSGGNIRRLTYGFFWADGADWSVDGSAIAFAGKKSREEKFQIFIADPLGLKFVQITTEGANEHPAFSADSRFLAYSSNKNGKWEIFIKGITVETPEIKVLGFERADCLEPAWSVSEKE